MEIVGIHDELQFVEDVQAIAQGLLAVAFVHPQQLSPSSASGWHLQRHLHQVMQCFFCRHMASCSPTGCL